MPSCCGLGSKSKDAPGTLSGETQKFGKDFRDKSLISIFEDRLKKKKINGKSTAVNFQDRSSFSYSQLNTFASCLARNIIDRLGFDFKVDNPDNELVIAVCLPMSDKAIALVLGIMKTGAAYLPLDAQYPENLLLEIISTFKPVMLITDDNGRIFNKYDVESFSSLCQLFTIEELWIDIEFPVEPSTRRPSMDLAWEIDFITHRTHNHKVPVAERPVVIFYSRGLLHDVTGVRLCTRSIINLIQNYWRKVGLYSKNDSCCLTVSLSNSVSIPQLFIPLLCGSTIHLFRRMDVIDTDNFVKNLSWRNINKLAIETSLFGEVLQSIQFLGVSKMLKRLSHLTLVSCRGSFIPHEMAKLFFSIFKHGVTLINCIGSVELSGEVALEQFHSLKDYESALIKGHPTIGTISDNVRIYVADEDMNLLPDGVKGEVFVSGNCLAVGYVSESSKEGEPAKFFKNPFHEHPPYENLFRTGEHAVIQKSSRGKRRLVMYGRHDSLVRVGGNIFSTADVTEYVKNLDGVENAFVCAFHAGQSDQLVIAFVQLKRGVVEDRTLGADYEFTLRNLLPEWAVPDGFKVFPGCLPDCKHKASMCHDCCLKIFEHEYEAMQMEEMSKLRPTTAAASNQYG